MAWVLAQPAITAPIMGASRPEQLQDSLKALGDRLDPELERRLDELTIEHRRGGADR